MPAFSGGLFGGTQNSFRAAAAPSGHGPQDARAGGKGGRALRLGHVRELRGQCDAGRRLGRGERPRAPKLPALETKADEAPADDATPEQDEVAAASDDDDKMVDKATTDEDGPTVELAPAAAEDEDAADDAAPEDDAAAEDADDATPEKAASDDDDSPKPTKIPKPRGRAPQGKAWDPDQGRWATQVDESDDDETLDVMRQRASRGARPSRKM